MSAEPIGAGMAGAAAGRGPDAAAAGAGEAGAVRRRRRQGDAGGGGGLRGGGLGARPGGGADGRHGGGGGGGRQGAGLPPSPRAPMRCRWCGRRCGMCSGCTWRRWRWRAAPRPRRRVEGLRPPVFFRHKPAIERALRALAPGNAGGRRRGAAGSRARTKTTGLPQPRPSPAMRCHPGRWPRQALNQEIEALARLPPISLPLQQPDHPSSWSRSR